MFRSTFLAPATPCRVFALSLTLVGIAGPLLAQPRPGCCEGPDDWGYRLHHHYQPAEATPRGGQEALRTVQEIVGLLLADPSTDWQKVSIDRLREHLVDLDLLMLRAQVSEEPIADGLEISVRGEARVLEAAHRQLPGHAARMNGFRGWRVESSEQDDVVTIRLHAQDEKEVAVIRGLGFFGFLASGVYRPYELLGIARGVDPSLLAGRAGSP